MTLTAFLHQAQQLAPLHFDDTMRVIAAHYTYYPTAFSNGLGDDTLTSAAGINQGSCKIFAFAQLHHLSVAQTLNLFGDYYHIDVLQHPHGTDHPNIRLFIRYGWAGICFYGEALKPL